MLYLKNNRLIFIVSSMHTGGAERVAARLVNSFALMGQDVSLIVTYSGRGECHYPLDNRVELIYLSDIAGSKGRGLITYLKRFVALRGILKERCPASVVAFMTQVNVVGILASLGLGMPVIVSERTHPP